MHHRHYLYFKLYVSSYEKNRCFGRWFLFFYAYIPTALFVHRYLQSSIPQPTPDLCPNTNNFKCTLNDCVDHGHSVGQFTHCLSTWACSKNNLERSYRVYICDHALGFTRLSGHLRTLFTRSNEFFLKIIHMYAVPLYILPQQHFIRYGFRPSFSDAAAEYNRYYGLIW